MYSFNFPDIFTNSQTKLLKDKEACKSNLKLVLLSCKKTLLGDPFFGSNLKDYLYEPNDVILKDLIMDEIYTTITLFIPQMVINRNDIKVTVGHTKLFVDVSVRYRNDIIPDMFTIDLTDV